MGAKVFGVVYALVLVAVIVGLDVTFLRHHSATRLVVNVAVVLAFASLYWGFFRRS